MLQTHINSVEQTVIELRCAVIGLALLSNSLSHGDCTAYRIRATASYKLA